MTEMITKTTNTITTNWKTTLAGIVAALLILLDQVQFYLDADPTTNPDFNVIVAAVAGLTAALFARDGDKSSKDNQLNWS